LAAEDTPERLHALWQDTVAAPAACAVWAPTLTRTRSWIAPRGPRERDGGDEVSYQ